MPINSNNAYRFSQIKKRRLTSQEAWLTQRLHELKTRIALQTKQKVNQPELQKQNIIDLTRQINAYLDQINTVQIRNILKTTLTLPQIEDKPEDISFAEENKQNLRTAIFHYLIQFDPKNPNKENKPRILSDQKIEALHLLLKILDKSNKDNVNSLVATWVKRIKQKNITSVTLILKKRTFLKIIFLMK